MNTENLSVREIQEQDIAHLISYWENASNEFLLGMGADPAKLPDTEQWQQMLLEQISKPYAEKASYCIIWLLDEKPVGHSNVNKIIFGKEAFMHLHLWNQSSRQSGIGNKMVKMTIPYFFKNLQIKTLYCEPYALNPAPNNTLKKIGFHFVKEYVTIPGFINFEQPVNLWQMTEETFRSAIAAEQ
jgi:RimJ/RimL family protein N-acetyltransferase